MCLSSPFPTRARGDVRRQSASTKNERRCGRRRRVYERSLSFCESNFLQFASFFSADLCKAVGGVLKLRDADKHTHTHTHARKERKIER